MSYWYIGSPYSKHPGALDRAHIEICAVVAEFARLGIACFSPIAHTHYAAIAGELDPLDYRIWMPLHEPIMTGSKGLIVVTMESWENSFGLRQEINYFKSARKPVRFLDPETLLIDRILPLSTLAPRPVPELKVAA